MFSSNDETRIKSFISVILQYFQYLKRFEHKLFKFRPQRRFLKIGLHVSYFFVFSWIVKKIWNSWDFSSICYSTMYTSQLKTLVSVGLRNYFQKCIDSFIIFSIKTSKLWCYKIIPKYDNIYQKLLVDNRLQFCFEKIS